MYFLCHAWSDSEVVNSVAKDFIGEFGETRVFYDRWNTQPGDSAIGGINEALEKCEVFFFFFGNESLNRAMVDREWQSALSRAIKGKNKFVIVRLDNIDPPAIVDDLACIDMFSYGPDEALYQMIAVCKGEKVVHVGNATPSRNLVSRIVSQSPTEMVVEISARRFAIQSPIIGVHMPSLGVNGYVVQPAKQVGTYKEGIARYRLPNGKVAIEMRDIALGHPIEPGEPLLLRISFWTPVQSVTATIFHCTGRAFICIPPEA